MSAPEERLGPYVLRARAGAGGMGIVYRAEHVETGAVHALKVLLPGAGPEDVQRSLREAEALARVDGHRNVVRVHSAGKDAGRGWIAMEWVDGGSLERRLASGPLPPDEGAALVRALAEGLAHAHARGVLHRDIKPANVLLDEDGTPKLTDFGLARVAGLAALTRTGEALGTPSCMAPEQALATGTDERTDVYGLGVLLFHVLTGRPPFQGSTAIAVMEKVISTPPPRARAFAPQVPPWLDDVCWRAMAKAPEDRYPSAAALAAALARPSRAAPRRLLALVVGAAALLCAVGLAAGLAVRTAPAPRPAPAPEPASEPAATADVAATLSSLVAAADWPAAGAALRGGLGAGDAAIARRWVHDLVARDAERAERVAAAAVTSQASAAVLVLAAEVSLARDRGAEAVVRANEALRRAPRDPGARGALGLALLLEERPTEATPLLSAWEGALGGRLLDLEGLRHDLAQLAGGLKRDRGGLGLGVDAELARLADLLAVIEKRAPHEIYPPLGLAGRALARRFAATFLMVDGELVRLAAGPVLEVAAGVAPDSAEGRCLKVLQLTVRGAAALRLPYGEEWDRTSTALIAALDQALEGELLPRYRTLAELTRFRLVAVLVPLAGRLPDEVARSLLDEVSRAERVRQASVDRFDPIHFLFLEHAEVLAKAHLALAWCRPAHRAEHVERVLALCADLETNIGAQPPAARARATALLMVGKTPDKEDPWLEKLMSGLIDASLALADDDPDGAIRALDRLRGQARVPPDVQPMLAIAYAVKGDLPRAKELSAEWARRAGSAGPVWLFWNTPPDVARAIHLIEQKEWRPTRDQFFPP